MDYTSSTVQFAYDLKDNVLFRKDAQNSINELSIQQLNTLANVSLLDIRLSTANVVEPHYHQNATELIYCISGAVTVSLINPFTRELRHFPITPGQVANVPQGWWHYLVATVDNTHLLAIFNVPIPEIILGSDILRLTPSNIMAHTYCLDEKKVQEALAPIKKPVIIGPPNDRKQQSPRKPGIHVRFADTSPQHRIAPQGDYNYTHEYPGFSFNPYQVQD